MARQRKNANWSIRRRIVASTLAFCAFVVVYCLWKVDDGTADSRILETAVNAAFTLAGAVIGTYVFGAVWQDVKQTELLGEPMESEGRNDGVSN